MSNPLLRRRITQPFLLMILSFCFGDITCPEGLILNHSNQSECFILFGQMAPISEIYGLNEEPSG